MKTTLLILTKDLRLFRIPIALWLAVLAGEAAFVLSGLDARVPVTGQRTSSWDFGLVASALAHIAMALVLVVGVVQADGPTSPSAFWKTRPISRWSVLGAKLSFILGVVLLPWVLVDMAVLLGRGASPHEAVCVGLGVLTVLVAFALPLACVASLAPSLGQALLILVAVGGYAVLAGSGVLAAFGAHLQGSRPEVRTLVGVLLAIILGGLSLAAIYSRFRRGVAAVVLFGIPAAIGLVHSSPTPPPPPGKFPASLRFAPLPRQRPVMLNVALGNPYRSATWPMSTATQAVGLSTGERIEPIWVRARVARESGKENLHLVLMPRQGIPQHPSLETRTMELAGLRSTKVFGGWDTIWIPDEGEQLSSSSTPAETRVRLALVTDRIVGRVPLHEGASTRQGSLQLEVVRTVLTARAELTLQETKPEPVLRFASRQPWEARYLGTRYWLYNAGYREALVLHNESTRSQSVPPVAFGLDLSRVSVPIEWPDQPRWRDEEARAEWLAGAEVLKTETTFLATGELSVPRLLGATAPETEREGK